MRGRHMAERKRRRSPRRTVVGAVIAVAVLLAVGAGVVRAAIPKPPGYRLATVVTGTADPGLTVAGTLQPVAESPLSFPIGGQVAIVNVRPGERVAAGQQLATLASTGPEAQLASARAAVATAQAKLSADEAGQSASATHVTTAARTTTQADT